MKVHPASVLAGVVGGIAIVLLAGAVFAKTSGTLPPAQQTRTPAAPGNGVAYLPAGSGDVGDQVNAAFAAAAGRAGSPSPSAVVMLAPGGRFSFATPIRIPNSTAAPFIEAPVLDCQGSTLVFAGSGYAINVAQQNGDSPSGQLRNCTLIPAPGNRAALGAVRQESRIWFTYDHLTVRDWTNPQGAGILLDNSRGGDWPGYNERNTLRDLSFANDTAGLRLRGNDGGTNSFGRITVEAICNLQDGQTCVSVENGADVYEANLSVHSNVYSPSGRARVLSITGASIVRNSLASIGGEAGGTSGALLYLDQRSKYLGQIGTLTNTGGLSIQGPGFTSDMVSAPIESSGFVLQATPDTLGLPQANNPKVTWDGLSLRMGLPIVGGYGNGAFQVYARDTSHNPEVDLFTEAASPQSNLFFCSSGAGTRDAGCGFGPGSGINHAAGGDKPQGATVPAAGTVDLGRWSLALNHVPVSQRDTAPRGPCSTLGWVLSNDGHISFCDGKTFITKI